MVRLRDVALRPVHVQPDARADRYRRQQRAQTPWVGQAGRHLDLQPLAGRDLELDMVDVEAVRLRTRNRVTLLIEYFDIESAPHVMRRGQDEDRLIVGGRELDQPGRGTGRLQIDREGSAVAIAQLHDRVLGVQLVQVAFYPFAGSDLDPRRAHDAAVVIAKVALVVGLIAMTALGPQGAVEAAS